MIRLYYILLIPCLILLACQTSPVSNEEELLLTNEQAIKNPTACQGNTTSGDCALLLSSIDYDFPDKECQVYDKLIQIDTKFEAPAGLENGSVARVDWEFLPNGNGGFWIVPIEETQLNKGTIRVTGCFSYGEQSTLRIQRSIRDHEGIESNTLTIDIPRPKEKGNLVNNSTSGFEILSYEANLF